MKYINLDELCDKLPPGWEERAQQALDLVRVSRPEERATVVNSRSQVWHDLKDPLAELSYDKCWYCEAKQIRSDNAVDHFRPKNSVAECSDHGGYWWLAFDWHNYRYSCTFCNSRRKDRSTGTQGGKQDHFPLVHVEARACVETDDLSREEPELLDPTEPDDPGLLWFGADGLAVEKYTEQDNALHYRRANKSIYFYHLNHTKLIDQRKLRYREIRKLVEEGDKHFQENWDTNFAAKRGFKRVAYELWKSINRKSEYSAAALSTLLELRSSYSWIDQILVMN